MYEVKGKEYTLAELKDIALACMLADSSFLRFMAEAFLVVTKDAN